MSNRTLLLSLGLVTAVVLATPAVGGTRHRARHVPKAMRLAAVDTGTGTTPTGMLRFAYRHGSLVCFGRFAHLAPDAQYQFQWGAQGTPTTTFTTNRRGCARFVTAPPTDPTTGQAQASVTPVDPGVAVLYCDWDWMMFGGVPTTGGTTTRPATPTTPPQNGSSTWSGMGCGWR